MHEHTTISLPGSFLSNVSGERLQPPRRLLRFLPREMRALLTLLLGVVAILLVTLPAVADSQARIVRLSELEGDVQIDRAVGQGFEKALMNLPITEGTRFRAGYDGFAEIEFEDGSTVRFTPDTVLEISQLVLRDSGAKATTVKVLQGVAYVNYEGTKNDEFLLTFGDAKAPLVKFEHIRLEVGPSKARLWKISQLSLCFWLERPELLRLFLQLSCLRPGVAALFGESNLGSVHRYLGLVYERWL
jgi:hypothetical protein